MNDLEAIHDLTPSDYSALMRGYKLSVADDKMLELERERLRNKMTETDAKGKPKHSNMKQIFDYQKEINEIMSEYEAIPKVDPELVTRFADSKKRAEDILNSRR